MVNIFEGSYQCETNGHYFQHVDMGLVFRPATMKGYIHWFQMSSPTVMTGIRIKECFGVWRVNGYSLNEAIGVHPPFQMEFDHTVDRNLMI